MQEIAVIGGGFSGCLIAKLLGGLGFKIHVFEASCRLMMGATNQNWFRQHMGPHYPLDDATAFSVQEASVVGAGFMQDFFYQGVPPTEYYVHSSPDMQLTLPGGGMLTPEAFMAALRRQQQHYAALLAKHPEAEDAFGAPGQYFTVLRELGMRDTALGIRSNERLVDLTLLINSLIRELGECQNIVVHRCSRVVDVSHDGRNFTVTVHNTETGDVRQFGADQVVQAGWSKGVELDMLFYNNLRASRGMPPVDSSYLNGTLHRLKTYAMVKGTRQASTHQLLLSHSAASYAYVGDGVGILEATHYNVLASSQGVRPAHWDDLIGCRAADRIAEQTLEYCGRFLPHLDGAEPHATLTAEVISGLDTGKRSADVLRETGAEALGVHGYHSVSGMKLSNVPLAAFTAVQRICALAGQNEPGTPEEFMRRMVACPEFRIRPSTPAEMWATIRAEARNNACTVEALRLTTVR